MDLIKTFNYSPNFDLKKRFQKKIKFLVFHYTGMKSENEAIKRLTNPNSKVSCHYFVKKNATVKLITKGFKIGIIGLIYYSG